MIWLHSCASLSPMSLVRRLPALPLAALTLAAAVLAGAGLAAAAEPRWVVTTVNDRGAMAIDLGNVRTTGEIRQIDGYIAFVDPGSDDTALYAIVIEFDCGKRLNRFVSQNAYGADGRDLGPVAPGRTWAPARPGSNAANSQAVVCDGAEGGPITLPADKPGIRRVLLQAIDGAGDRT